MGSFPARGDYQLITHRVLQEAINTAKALPTRVSCRNIYLHFDSGAPEHLKSDHTLPWLENSCRQRLSHHSCRVPANLHVSPSLLVSKSLREGRLPNLSVSSLGLPQGWVLGAGYSRQQLYKARLLQWLHGGCRSPVLDIISEGPAAPQRKKGSQE